MALDEKNLTVLRQKAHIELPDWEMSDTELKRWFEFESFVQAIKFVEKVADVAEKQNHHPDIDIRYRKVFLRLTSHDVGGLSERDVELALAIGDGC